MEFKCKCWVDGNIGRVYSVAFNPLGTMVASCGDDGKIRIWSHATGALLAQLDTGSKNRLWHTAWSPDGRSVLATGDEGVLYVWGAR